jgi:lipoprotein-anchoring transpeptidase ErfK/SrfK
MKKTILGLLSAALIASMAVIPAEAAKKRKRYKASPPAAVQVHIDISSQSMNVRVNGSHYASWRVSTGRAGYYTPRGTFGVKRMARMHYSRKYDNAPMPNSIFFHGGYAIHGTGAIRALGRPASHGCVRLHPSNAAALFALVQRHGRRARITLTN